MKKEMYRFFTFYAHPLLFSNSQDEAPPSKGHMPRHLLQLIRVHVPWHRDTDRVVHARHLVPEPRRHVQCITRLEVHDSWVCLAHPRPTIHHLCQVVLVVLVGMLQVAGR